MTYVKNWLDGVETDVGKAYDRTIGSTSDDLRAGIGAAESELMDVSSFLNQFDTRLPHYKNSRAAVNAWEPVFLNQFDVVITPPQKIYGDGYYTDLLIEEVKSVSGLPEITPTGVVEQQFMWAKRVFSKPVPENPIANLEMRFEVNVNNRGHMYAYEMLRAWANLSFDPMRGSHGMRPEYSGEITVMMQTKARRTIRTFNFKNVFMDSSMTPMDLDYLNGEIYVLTVRFVSDNWVDSRIPMLTTA